MENLGEGEGSNGNPKRKRFRAYYLRTLSSGRTFDLFVVLTENPNSTQKRVYVGVQGMRSTLKTASGRRKVRQMIEGQLLQTISLSRLLLDPLIDHRNGEPPARANLQARQFLLSHQTINSRRMHL
jgi:hypothetical protein